VSQTYAETGYPRFPVELPQRQGGQNMAWIPRVTPLILSVLVLLVTPRAQAATDLEGTAPKRSSLSWVEPNPTVPATEPILIAGKGNRSDSGIPAEEKAVTDEQTPKAPSNSSDSPDSLRGERNSGSERGRPAGRGPKHAVPDPKPTLPSDKKHFGGHPLKFFRPVITSAWMPNPSSGVVYFKGEHFGEDAGTIRLYTKYMPGGNTPSGARVDLKNVVWTSSTQVRGSLPNEFSPQSGALCRKQVVFEIARANKTLSERYVMNWPEEEQELDYTKVELEHCGCGANYNTCSDGVTSNRCDKSACPYELPQPGSGHVEFGGYHQNCGKIGEVTNEGHDKFKIKLENGWYFHDIEIFKKKTDNAVIKPPQPAFPTDKSSWIPSFHWTTPKDAWLRYDVHVQIKGPLGCSPYK